MPFSSLSLKRSLGIPAGQTPPNRRADGVILRHPGSLVGASHQVPRRIAMRDLLRQGFRPNLFLASILVVGASCAAQQPQGPQSDAPAPVAPKPAPAQAAGSNEKITVPSGTRVGLVLQNGIPTRIR